MGGSLQPEITRAGASFELERLELDEGMLVVRGWWSGVRGMRFVRPALIVEGRKLLATLEHKPWAIGPDDRWMAAFAWEGGAPPDLSGVILAVAPSIEVPLDRESAPPPPPAAEAMALAPAAEPPPAPVAQAGQPLRDELRALEGRLDAVREELHEARAIAAEREARCRELEQAAARERRAAEQAGDARAARALESERARIDDDALVRAHAIAVRDRDRAVAQHEEAVVDREAAVRTRRRMEAQRDEALAQRDAAQAQREQAASERDEARSQRDEILLAYRTLEQQLKSDRASSQRAQPPEGPRERPVGSGASRTEAPSGVRVVPGARKVAAHLHRGERERERGVTKYDMWMIRILGSVAALAFISLLVMILKAFFVF